MTDNDYPALYRSASDLSQISQNAFYRAFLGYSCLLVIASVISVINSPCPEVAIVQALVLALALFGAVYLYVVRPDRHWYSGRAIAESIKTITWRFAMKAEPFHDDDEMARQKFGQKLKAIVSQNLDVAKRLTTHLDGIQITEAMITMRSCDVDERRQHYIKSRIVDQQHWYAKKAAFNKKMVRLFFSLLIITNILAIGFAIAKVRYPSAPYWPTDALVTIAASLLSWIQAKRFQELSASYALAAHEISLIREQANRSMTETQLSDFIADAESAFSREHTQWVARMDT